MRISYTSLICKIAIAYPVIYTFLSLISASLARDLAVVVLLMVGLGVFLSKKKEDMFWFFGIVGLTMINAVRFGLNYVVHQDYYGFVLLIFLFIYFSDKKKMMTLEREFSNTIRIETLLYLYYIVILLSVLLKNGLRVSSDWGVTMPMLYGPYGLPHVLSYQLIISYALTSILYHYYPKRKYAILMIFTFVLIAWTGVRSAFLAVTIMVFLDIKSYKNVKTKAIVIFIGIFALMYLALFTNVLADNPITQKTMIAAGKASGITNGRLDFNNYLTKAFFERTTTVEKIFGIGIENLRKLMYLRYATELHAHNDFFNALLGMGIVGLMIYSINLYRFCKTSKKGFYVFLVLFVLLFTNGLYMYIGFTPSIAILVLYADQLFRIRSSSERLQKSFVNYTRL